MRLLTGSMPVGRLTCCLALLLLTVWIQSASSIILSCYGTTWPSNACPKTNVLNARCTKVGNGFGAVVTWSCYSSFNLNGSASVTCQSDRTWSPALPTCVPAASTCSAPPPGTNTVAVPAEVFPVGAQYNYSCLPYYEYVSGSLQTVCTSSNFWSPPPPVCDLKKCLANAIPNLTNGVAVSPKDIYLNNSLTLQCQSGYITQPQPSPQPNPPEINQTVTCLPDGTFTLPTKNCSAIACVPANIPVIAHGTPNNPVELYIGGKVTVTCDADYMVDPQTSATLLEVSQVLTCVSNATFSPARSCIYFNRLCGPPAEGTNTVAIPNTPNTYANGTTFSYSCAQYYEPPPGADLNVTCNNGSWIGIPLACQLIGCDTQDVPPLSHATSPSSHVDVNSTITLTCDANYITDPQPTPYPNLPETNQTVTCLIDGNFTTPTKTCVYYISHCAAPANGTNTQIVTASDHPNGTSFSYTCLVNYEPVNGSQLSVTCSNGTWSALPPTCQLKGCEVSKIPIVSFATTNVTTSRVDAGQTVTIVCNENYITDPQPASQPSPPEYNQTVACLLDGNFTVPAKKCVYFISTCNAPPRGNNTEDVPPGSHLDRESFNYTCLPDYEPPLGAQTFVTCSNGSWIGTPLACQLRSCAQENIPTVLNAHPYVIKDVTVNESISLVCDDGFITDPQPTNSPGSPETKQDVTCTRSGSFTPPTKACVALVEKCPNPPEGNFTAPVVKDCYVAGVNYTYSCILGYEPVDASNLTVHCVNGTWTAANAVCKRKTCSTIPQVQFATAHPNTAVDYEAIVTLVCDPGYIVNPQPTPAPTPLAYNQTVICTADGTFTLPTKTCINFNPSCSSPANGTNTVAVPQRIYAEGELYTYTCEPDYEPVSGVTYTTTCRNGTWTVPPPTCTIRTCNTSSIQTVAHSSALISPGVIASVNTVVTISCSPLYIKSGQAAGGQEINQTVTCRRDGSFSTPASQCIYQYPASCREFFMITGNANAQAQLVTIDPDGDSSLISPFDVYCSRSDNTACAKVTARGGTYVAGSTENCTVADIPRNLTVASHMFEDQPRVCNSSFSSVQYTLNSSQISDLISTHRGGCKQKVTWTCAGMTDGLETWQYFEIPDFIANHLFAAILHHSLPMSKVYNIIQQDVIAWPAFEPGSEPNLRSSNGVCDCVKDGCTFCNCARESFPSNQDTITISLTQDQQEYVEGLLLGVAGPYNNPSNSNATQALTVGDIECCEQIIF